MKSETLTSIGANARRLFADGELLYRAERYPSALALAILSIEEAGKYYLLKWSAGKERTPAFGTQAHKDKQSVHASFVMALEAIEEVRAFIGKFGFGDSPETIQGFLRALTAHQRGADEEWKAKAYAAEEKIVEHVASALASSDGSKLRHLIKSGGVQKLKHRAGCIWTSMSTERSRTGRTT